jgi:hypothetical protein
MAEADILPSNEFKWQTSFSHKKLDLDHVTWMLGFILPKNGCETHFGSENIMDVSKVPRLDIRVVTLDLPLGVG